ncbi:hypothetical protein NPIL_33911 [Nephila pilipes]|uniref:Uncharacterized protein n=1 Tax=Nephila pilipes TaxID=299642 RepID=A0A8X6NDM3_NEPPI|nr:hypothetical protein NPIL_33911 [Nephila pilipes]
MPLYEPSGIALFVVVNYTSGHWMKGWMKESCVKKKRERRELRKNGVQVKSPLIHLLPIQMKELVSRDFQKSLSRSRGSRALTRYQVFSEKEGYFFTD